MLDSVVQPGYGLLNGGACCLDFEICPVCMQELGHGGTSPLFCQDVDFVLDGAPIKLCFVLAHKNCELAVSDQTSCNLRRLIDEFACTVLV